MRKVRISFPDNGLAEYVVTRSNENLRVAGPFNAKYRRSSAPGSTSWRRITPPLSKFRADGVVGPFCSFPRRTATTVLLALQVA